jgi:hypothetical protein
MPLFGASASLHDLSVLAAYEGDDEGERSGVPDAAEDEGIPAFEEPAAVLPVPPPASAEPTGRRRGRKAKSAKSKSR